MRPPHVGLCRPPLEKSCRFSRHIRRSFFGRLLLLAAFLLASLLWCPQPGVAQPKVTIQQTPASVANGKAQLLGQYNLDQKLRLVFALQPPRLQEEEQFLGELQDRDSPLFHKYLSAEEWNARFAPSPQDEQAVVDWATSQGLTITQRYPNRLLVDVAAPTAIIEKALDVTINRYQIDSTEFYSITEELSTHYRQLAESCDHITLVFDKGNNSQEAFDSLQDTPFHFVGSLVPSQHSELLSISRKQFRTLTQPGLEGVEAYRTDKKVFGQPRTIVVTFNQNLYDGQLQGLSAHLGKVRRKLRDLQTQLQRRRDGKIKRGKAPTLDSVKKQIHTICSAQFVEKILKAEIQQVGKGLELTFRTDPAALDRLCRFQFGKTILFTDNADWTDEQIISAYRSQYHIEDAFKQMKNPHFLGWSPMFHWTDSKIQVHAFYCVLALLLTSLLQRELAQKGESLSINRMLEELGGIRETLIVYPRRQGQRKAATATCLTRMTALQQRLFSLLSLQRFVPAAR